MNEFTFYNNICVIMLKLNNTISLIIAACYVHALPTKCTRHQSFHSTPILSDFYRHVSLVNTENIRRRNRPIGLLFKITNESIVMSN